LAWSPDDPFPSSTALGETDAGARRLPAFLCSLLRPGPVLVVGAGEVALHAAAAHPVTVLDWNPRRLRALEEVARQRGIDLRMVCLDPEQLDSQVRARSFPNVVCMDVLERQRDGVAFLRRLHRILEAGGHLVVRVRTAGVGAEPGPGAPRSYEPETLRALLEEGGFRAKRVRHWNFLGVPCAVFWDRWMGRAHRDPGGSPSSERPRGWWDAVLDRWYESVEGRVGFPVGMSLVAVATPYVERARVPKLEAERGLSRRRRDAYEPMASSR
jgi:SAM-dependent methyltransferase